MTALAGAHLELSARLGSRQRRRRPPLPRRARRNRWRAGRLGGGLGRGRAFLGGVDAGWQRSTVKTSYSRNGRSASWAAHGTYLAREGAQRGGGKGRGFSAEQEGIDIPATLRSWQRAGDERLWKFGDAALRRRPAAERPPRDSVQHSRDHRGQGRGESQTARGCAGDRSDDPHSQPQPFGARWSDRACTAPRPADEGDAAHSERPTCPGDCETALGPCATEGPPRDGDEGLG